MAPKVIEGQLGYCYVKSYKCYQNFSQYFSYYGLAFKKRLKHDEKDLMGKAAMQIWYKMSKNYLCKPVLWIHNTNLQIEKVILWEKTDLNANKSVLGYKFPSHII